MQISQQPRFGELRITMQEHPTRYYKGYTGLTLMPEKPGVLTYNHQSIDLTGDAKTTLNALETALAAKPADKKAFDQQARDGIRKILNAVTEGLSVRSKPSFRHTPPLLAYYKDRLGNVLDSGDAAQPDAAPASYRVFTRA